MKLAALVTMVAISCASVLQSEDLAKIVLTNELAGENAGRLELLSSIPEDKATDQIHWLRGEVRVGNEWVPYAKVVDHGDRWAKLNQYREQRAKRGNSLGDQLDLADGCREQQLLDEERAHLRGMLDSDSNNREARQRLGDLEVQGVWITANEAQSADRMIRENQNAAERWSSQLTRVVKDLSDRTPKRRAAALQSLLAIRDPATIPVLENLLGRGSEQQQLDFTNWLRELNSWKSSAALARLATGSESASVRVEATRILKNRRMEEYVPTILSTMVTPISIRAATQRYNNWASYSQVATFETQDRSVAFHYTARYGPELLLIKTIQLPWGIERYIRLNPTKADQEDGEILFSVLSAREQDLTVEQNGAIAKWNDRCNRVLTQSTGCGGMTRPEEWWSWWEDDQGYAIDSKDQVFGQYHEEWYIKRQSNRLQRDRNLTSDRTMTIEYFQMFSCFSAGTLVVTEFGQKPIETIRRGDRVLSQDVETGELSFKPVFHTTIRTSPESAIVKFGDEQLTCTSGHPFWVNGKGWRMARELEPGDGFHSINGAVDVVGVDAGEKEEVFNLEVADFHTYFVGKNPILTHDVTVRQPTDMAIPGFAKETAAAVSSK